ncbi:gliding motility-associated C-terminal domain-containing protein [Gramella sp. GC03-9]|uniref:Gliding motility-associated C-terminal domain-containing protein n=1 Tax=Christiangramia oceanisediminis TaxID=2920386 RepID=A0A9X2RCC6_9FLAO|nr:gliding motility-associated C-terminal domain-containing protein [Gramella oceanisediminis]MCP9201564.1 gliding motility-associated C-terminal domain-containing protein [Gramella oceanisediminis]
MQNFTFRRKGINWFLFAFILFVGNLPAAQAQNCPTVTSEQESQNFCYLSRVSDLQATPNGDGVQWYRTATSTVPIPSDEILQDGSYFAGNNSGNCNARPEVTVTVDDLGPPTTTFGNFYEPCEYSSEDVTTVGDLKNLVVTSESGYDINVFGQEDEFGTNELPDNAVLVDGNSYFIGQDDPSSSCEYSSRIAIQYNPILATAPAAEAAQVYCEGATVSDLEAEGINRWYSTATSNPFLDPSTPLVDGATYYASQIVNRTNSSLPPCESQDRTAVTVTITEGPDAGEDNVGVVCQPEVSTTFPSEDAVRNFYLDLLAEGVPSNGTFSPSISNIVSQYQADEDGLGDFTVTYTIGEDECSDSVDLTIRIIEETPAEAGSFNDINDVCAEDMMIDLTALTNNDSEATTGGTFSGTGVSENQFDPSVGEGEYEITYSVDETSAPCTTGSDSTTFTIFVSEANAGDDISETLCSSDLENLADFADEIAALLEGRDTDGTFSPDPAIVYARYQNDLASGSLPQTYDLVYTVNDGTCTDQANIEITVNPSPDAGEDAIVDLLPTDDPINLFDELGGTPDMGGTWSPGDGTFDPATDTPGTFTYTVSNDFGCEDSATVTVSVETETECEGAAGNDNIGVVCEDDVANTFPSNDEVRKYYLSLLDNGVSRTGTFNPTIAQIIDEYQDDADGLGDFTVTYTITTTDGCTDSTNLTIRVIEEGPGEAGSFDDIIDVCSNDASIDLTNLTNNNPEATLGGTFSGDGVADNTFDPSVGPGTYTITYSVDDTLPCVTSSDETTFTITVIEGADAGEDATVELSSTDDPIELFDFLGGTPEMGGTWSPGNGTFDPATDAPGEFVYTVTNGNCEDSATVTVTVDSETECEGAAGDDNVGVVCEDDVPTTFTSNDEVRKYYLNLLDNGVSRTGTFNPTIAQIINEFQNDADGLGDFTVTYTITTTDGCTDSTNLTIRVIEEGPGEAGSFDDIIDVCSNDASIDLTDLTNNNPEATLGGTFSGDGVTDNTFDPSVGPGTYTITYSVDDTLPCVTSSDETTFTITVIEGVDAGEDATVELSSTDDPIELFDFLGGTPEMGGTWSPGNGTFDPATDAPGEFVYTVTNGNCEDSATVTVIITDCPEELTANAGNFDNISDACSNGDVIDLSELMNNDENAIEGGTFTGEGVMDNMFDPTSVDNGTYTITYTVDETTPCVTGSDSTTFTITVSEPANIGTDTTADVCVLDVQDLFPDIASVRNFYLNLLDDGVARTGTFSPSIQQVIAEYQADEDGLGDFSTVYTLTSEGGCASSVTLTASIFEADVIEIEQPGDQSLCLSDDAVNLSDYLADGTLEGGSFAGYDDGTFDPSVVGEGTYDITYTVRGEGCSQGTTTFSITVTDAAYAGEDMEFDVCMNAGIQDLYLFLSADADMDGEFTYNDEVITDGLMDPSAFEAGEYEVTYTVTAINDCGDDTATFTITVLEAADAPELNDISFCAIQNPTGLDLIAENANLTFYTDEDLTMMVMEEDELVAGTYYATLTPQDGCESEAASFTVTINDPGTPTIDDANPVFCEYDDATIADLNDAVDQTSNVTWFSTADGTESLSTGTPLQDGVTYYASLYDPATDCDSSARLAVTVTIEGCPLLFPEGISPNGDGRNDVFDIENIEREYPNYTIEIYNRWGKVVYKGNANTPDWDGTTTESGALGDDTLPVGVYFYLLDFNDGVTSPRRGKVYLSR